MASTSARCSSSDDEADRSAELNETKRVRRRRGRRTRKKSERDSPSSEFGASPSIAPVFCRKRTCSLGAPPAPRNTNDFLIEDMEKREEDTAKRVRREEWEREIDNEVERSSGGVDQINGEDEFEDQYEESWQECVIDKYKGMNHDELARRMAVMEKNHDEVERKLRWERSKSDYLQGRLQKAEERIREKERDGADADDYSPSSPHPPVPIPSSCVSSALLDAPNCSPNVISSPRA
ncbi:hypothetical protein PFISCL1PPCAC_11934 [Pristionchus fissidentatus]|uniref:Uncharacterized protein n=1 Tax=Pristionchus fissidentatus TaxID=1538716 RepID=A0AAV5VRK0_9BILA|nr:hypothetical protein PFISCL1PPCAC_11934 [Pristionchus fissidentatus]